MSVPNITKTNLDLGICQVIYKGVDLGATLGNVTVKIEQTTAPIKADQLGETEIDSVINKMALTVDTELAEVLDKSKWKVVFPDQSLLTSGPNQSFQFTDKTGTFMAALGGNLLLHPLKNGDTDKSEDILIYTATADPKSQYIFSPKDQKKLKISWKAYPDFTTSPPRYALFGDPAIGLVHASAGSPVAGGGNIGNGTVTNVAVFDGQTNTETVTLLCVTPGATGEFYVSGSVSGALGLAQVGVTFSSPKISFKINDGATHFAANDSFTIATVASNTV